MTVGWWRSPSFCRSAQSLREQPKWVLRSRIARSTWVCFPRRTLSGGLP